MRGIYKIENKINGKVYIGESLDIYNRWNTHIKDLNNKCHHSYKLQEDWDKYGEDNFEFKTITVLDKSIARYVDKIILLIYEDIYIKQYNALFDGYNYDNTLENIENGINKNFNSKDRIYIKQYKQKVLRGEIINNGEEILINDKRELFVIFPNNLFHTDGESESIYKLCNNNNKAILVMYYLYMNTTRYGLSIFSIKDIIKTFGYKENRQEDGINKQIISIIKIFKNKNIIECDINLDKIKLSDMIFCKYNGIDIDNNGNMINFTRVLCDNVDKIMKYNHNSINNVNLLFYYGYLCSRMYFNKKDNDGKYNKLPEVCRVSYDKIFYDTDISSSTIKKYNDLLVELDLIRVGNCGLYYVGERKSVKESCNIYTLVDKNDIGV